MSHDITKKQIIKIIVVALLLGACIFLYDFYMAKINFDGTISRNEAGQGSVTEELELEYCGEKRNEAVEIADMRLSEEEIEKSFDKAISEINDTYLGENKSADCVNYDLNLKSSYAEGLIKADWEFNDYSVITYEGEINLEDVPQEGSLVNALAKLRYEDIERTYGFSFMVRPFDVNSPEAREAALKKALEEANSNNSRRENFVLPVEINGKRVKWSKKVNYRGLEIAMLGFVAAIALVVGKENDKKKSEKAILLEKERDYPLIVSELSVLIGAGMSLRKALERICDRYIKNVSERKENTRAGYEEMLMTYRAMKDGRGEMAALEDLGVRSEQKEYRKLAMLLSQNVKKGSQDLICALEQEEINAFNLRKQRAVRLGEEASTKLLLPMGGMLMIVMVILIVPAIMQMNI